MPCAGLCSKSTWHAGVRDMLSVLKAFRKRPTALRDPGRSRSLASCRRHFQSVCYTHPYKGWNSTHVRTYFIDWNFKCKLFNLKRNPNYYTWTPLRIRRKPMKIPNLCSCTSLLQLMHWNQYGRNISWCVVRWTFVTHKHFLYPEMLPHGVVFIGTFLSANDFDAK
jgi:hypothetical protein